MSTAATFVLIGIFVLAAILIALPRLLTRRNADESDPDGTP
jgi:hypothetical protein